MARARALANGPVEFASSGTQISLSLTAIFFDGNTVSADAGLLGDLYKANKKVADDWLAYQAANGLLRPAAQPPVKTAMVIKANDPGSNGNFIQIAFSNFDETNPNDPKFDTAVTESNTYTNLTPSTVQTVLGAAAGAKPGLVFVSGPSPAELPKAGSYPLVMVPNNTFAAADIQKNSGSGNAFTVQAKADGPDGAKTKVEIKDVDTSASAFTLVATWTKTASQITSSQLGSNLDFAYLITIDPPADGAISVPVAGTVTLKGGSDAVGAEAASATVPG
jgi:hypothetical protein